MMRIFPVVLWAMLCVATAVMFICALFIHRNVLTFLLTIALVAICAGWYEKEIKPLLAE